MFGLLLIWCLMNMNVLFSFEIKLPKFYNFFFFSLFQFDFFNQKNVFSKFFQEKYKYKKKPFFFCDFNEIGCISYGRGDILLVKQFCHFHNIVRKWNCSGLDLMCVQWNSFLLLLKKRATLRDCSHTCILISNSLWMHCISFLFLFSLKNMSMWIPFWKEQ